MLMSSYSMDLRERIVSACAAGATQKSVSLQFGVCLKTVQRYVRRARLGTLAPKPLPGKAWRLDVTGHQQLTELVASRSDWTLETLARQLHAQTGVLLASSTLHDALRRQGLSYKKRVVSPANAVNSSVRLSGRS